MTSRKKPGVAFWATGTLFVGLVLFGAYAMAYFWTVRPSAVNIFAYESLPPTLELVPEYDVGGNQSFWKAVFAPAHRIDRRIRPNAWVEDCWNPDRGRGRFPP